MEAIEALRQDVRAGRIGAERLLDLLEALMRRFEVVTQQLDAAQQRIAELERKINQTPPKLDEAFSL